MPSNTPPSRKIKARPIAQIADLSQLGTPQSPKRGSLTEADEDAIAQAASARIAATAKAQAAAALRVALDARIVEMRAGGRRERSVDVPTTTYRIVWRYAAVRLWRIFLVDREACRARCLGSMRGHDNGWWLTPSTPAFTKAERGEDIHIGRAKLETDLLERIAARPVAFEALLRPGAPR